MSGFVYVLTNSSIPGLVKIGLTNGSVKSRARALQSTGVPTPFKVEYAVEYKDPALLESRVHGVLKRYRSHRREFFSVPVDLAKTVVDKVLANIEE